MIAGTITLDVLRSGLKSTSACGSPGHTPLFPSEAYRDRLPFPHELRAMWARSSAANVCLLLGPASGTGLLSGLLKLPELHEAEHYKDHHGHS